MAEKEYIEREAVIDLLKEMRKDGKAIPWEGKDIFNALRKLPAADVRPAVQGKWVESKSMMEVLYCSECGFRTINGTMPEGLGRNYSYCPNCGADMREES